eukprot:TRINITY_DN5452_c0_g1_i1.p1 TRINITY_DN5452_c0_g1~~TRINITY_DN5452_c0_g1_i1.p1  ORF type:complete len:378 (-),score=30.34 TRINITY_DN5452_c0_g1_i1:73-1101(-)
MDDKLWGMLAVLGAILSFGTFGVPIKSKKVIDAKVDPVVFQTYKSAWVFITSLITFTYNKFSYTPWGILGGFFWVPGGIAAVIAVNCIGLGVAQGVWSGIIILFSFAIGTLIFHEPLKSLTYALGGITLLVIGVVGMAMAPTLLKPRKEVQYAQVNTDQAGLVSSEATPTSVQPAPGLFATMSERKRKVLGFAAATVSGLNGACVMVPLKIAGKHGFDTSSGINYVFSFAVGVLLVTSALFLVYALVRIFLMKQSMPSFHFRIMLIPGSIAGILWSAGNYFSIYAVILLGQAVSVPATQTALIISGLWGILYYRELKGHQITIWSSAALITVGGIALLSQSK